MSETIRQNLAGVPGYRGLLFGKNRRGLFAVLAIVCKYLSRILSLTFQRQTSLVEGIEKIQK